MVYVSKGKRFQENHIYLYKLNFMNLQAVEFFSVSPFSSTNRLHCFIPADVRIISINQTCQKWILGCLNLCLRNTTINSEFKNSQLLEKFIINKVRPKVGGKKFCFVISTRFISVKSEIRLNLRVVKQRI